MMKLLRLSLTLVFFSLAVAVALPAPSIYAAEPQKQSDCPQGTALNKQTNPNTCITQINPASLPKTSADKDAVHRIVTIINSIVGAIALLVLVVNGLRYITSGGDPQKSTNAKNGIVYALAGVAVVIAAQAIVSFIAQRLG